MVEIEECPQCGAPAKPSDRHCEFCKAEFFISNAAYLGGMDLGGINKYLQHYKKLTKENPESAEGYLGLGITQLLLKIYPLALKSFDKAIELEPGSAPAYYYSCLAKIQGRRLTTMTLNEIREIEQLANAASQIDPGSPVFRLLLALIKREYYEANGLKVVPPSACEIVSGLDAKNIPRTEIQQLKNSILIRDDFFVKLLTAE